MFFWKPTGRLADISAISNTVRLIELSARVNGNNALVAAIAEVTRERQTSGGRVFIADLDSYEPA